MKIKELPDDRIYNWIKREIENWEDSTKIFEI